MNDRPFLSYIKTTLIGGLFVLVPIALVVMLVLQVIVYFRALVAPISDRIKLDWIGGETVSRIIALSAIVLVCFIVGLLAETRVARGVIEWMEDNIFSRIPGYEFLKGMSESIAGLKLDDNQRVVLIDLEETWQIAFLIERIDDQLSTVYIPGAPNPMSGNVVIVKNERIKLLDIGAGDALKICGLGAGSRKKLNGKIDRDIFTRP
jgi:uncharacterized membrane protein